MKKFSFRLEKVLRLKERIETLKRGEYGAAAQRVSERERALAALDSERERCSVEEQKLLTGEGLDVMRLRTYSRYFNHLRGEMRIGTEIKRALQKDAEVKRQSLIVSSREKKTLERYKEKLELSHIRDMDKAEQQELDELGAIRYIRNSNKQSG